MSQLPAVWIEPVVKRAALELDHFDLYLQPDWDGDGALAVTEETYGKAKEVISWLPFELSVGSAMAGVDGSVGLYWANQRARIYLDVLPDCRVRYVCTSGEFERMSGVHAQGAPLLELVRALRIPLRTFVGKSLGRQTLQFNLADFNVIATAAEITSGNASALSVSDVVAANDDLLEVYLDQAVAM